MSESSESRTWRLMALLLLGLLLLAVGVPAAWATWGSPPEARGRVPAHEDGTTVAEARPLWVRMAAAIPGVVDLVRVGGAAVTLGAKTAALSIPVTLDTTGQGYLSTTATQTTTTATQTTTTATNTGTLAGAVSAGRVAVNAIAGQVGVSGGAGNSDALTLRTHPAGLATLAVTGDSVVSGGADDTIAADAGQAVVCVQSVDQDGVLCVGDSGGTGAACADAVRLGAALVAGGPGGSVCAPTSGGLTVNGVSGTLSYVWWRVE